MPIRDPDDYKDAQAERRELLRLRTEKLLKIETERVQTEVDRWLAGVDARKVAHPEGLEPPRSGE